MGVSNQIWGVQSSNSKIWDIKPIPNPNNPQYKLWRTLCCSQIVGKGPPKADERPSCQVSSCFHSTSGEIFYGQSPFHRPKIFPNKSWHWWFFVYHWVLRHRTLAFDAPSRFERFPRLKGSRNRRITEELKRWQCLASDSSSFFGHMTALRQKWLRNKRYRNQRGV